MPSACPASTPHVPRYRQPAGEASPASSAVRAYDALERKAREMCGAPPARFAALDWTVPTRTDTGVVIGFFVHANKRVEIALPHDKAQAFSAALGLLLATEQPAPPSKAAQAPRLKVRRPIHHLTEEETMEAWALYSSGEANTTELSRRYHVSPTVFYNRFHALAPAHVLRAFGKAYLRFRCCDHKARKRSVLLARAAAEAAAPILKPSGRLL